ncbi:MAG: restriction endonuclease subunit S [Treponema sp.]|nr:restriction endonuclease subunit S [Treponema sp.]
MKILIFLLDYCNLNQYSESSAQPGLSVQKLIIKRFSFPCKEEQQKIADCLSSLDSLIQTQQKLVTTWQQRKKALLQQMFV